MIERHELLDSYTRHLTDTSLFSLAEAVNALERCYNESRIENVDDNLDRLILLAGVFEDEPRYHKISLHRQIDFFTGLSVDLVYRRGMRSYFSPSTTLVSEAKESDSFFSDVRASWTFWWFKNVLPFRVKVDCQDSADKHDGFYDSFFIQMESVFTGMRQAVDGCRLTSNSCNENGQG